MDDIHGQKDDHVKRQQEDSHLQAKRRWTRENQSCQAPWSLTCSLQNYEIYISVILASQSMEFCCGSPSKLIQIWYAKDWVWFWYLSFMVFFELLRFVIWGKFLAIISSNVFSCLIFPLLQLHVHFTIWHFPSAFGCSVLFLPHFIFFSSLPLYRISIDLFSSSISFSFAVSSLLMALFQAFFIFVSEYLSFSISIWFFLIVDISLLSVWFYMLSNFSIRSFNILIIIILNSL